MGAVFRYALHGAASFLGNLAITFIAHEILGWSSEVAFAVAQVTLFVINFWIARHFVFRATAKDAARQFRDYAGTSLTFRLGEYLLFVFLVRLLHVPYLTAAAGSLIASFGTKFVVYRRFVFSH